MLRCRVLTMLGRSRRLASWPSVAHPAWFVAVAAIAARTSLAAPTSAGSMRLAGLVNSLQRFAMRFHAIWLASSDGASRWSTSTSIWPFCGGGFGQDAGGAGDQCLHPG